MCIRDSRLDRFADLPRRTWNADELNELSSVNPITNVTTAVEAEEMFPSLIKNSVLDLPLLYRYGVVNNTYVSACLELANSEPTAFNSFVQSNLEKHKCLMLLLTKLSFDANPLR
eukprot:TRINITY_DN0_c7081_g1_i1.p1 TRINITY_DN0_c7081_g1~~TRINITY_DN0_c7081_g1_i1.p1  ORF type:complete len:115 (-),score=21.24 TRINITY_DN0_c7081_g1_i1:159-503(-)